MRNTMRTLLIGLIGLSSTSITFTTSKSISSIYNAHAFDNLSSLESNCEEAKSKDSCFSMHCNWCTSAAVPSACYNDQEAAQLPSAVFHCEKKEMDKSHWELKELPSTVHGMRTLFQYWKTQNSKSYISPLEEEMRSMIFNGNVRSIVEHNNDPNARFTLEANEFADLTWEEFKSWYLSAPQNCSATVNTKVYDGEVPESKDWRKDGMVSPVKNQGRCGSCWTFSTTGCLESHLLLKHHKLVPLSEQNLLDCAQDYDTHGCNGGLPSHAFEYIHYNGGIDTEATYPYQGRQGKCKYDARSVGARVMEIVNITSHDETQLKAAVGTVGPVSIAFQVASDFRFYRSGVYESKKCHSGNEDVNHAVLAVGYGTDTKNKKYWIVKNSWGELWGNHGFFEIARDENMCGLADCAAYPVIE